MGLFLIKYIFKSMFNNKNVTKFIGCQRINAADAMLIIKYIDIIVSISECLFHKICLQTNLVIEK